MAGSPTYLAALNEMEEQLSALVATNLAQPDWETFDALWEHHYTVTGANLRNLLWDAAVEAYLIALNLTNTNVSSLMQKMRDMHISKNAGYAGADNPDPWFNFRMCERDGVSAARGVLVRLGDKYARTINLRKDPSNDKVGEPLVDSVCDYAAYCLIHNDIATEAANA